MMKKPLVTALLLLHMVGNTELCQLISVPKLFEHFRIHQQWNPRASFADFIEMHYLGTDGIDGDDPMDHELPFMHFDHQTVLVATAPPHVCSALDQQEFAEDQTFQICKYDELMPAYVGSLLRPPRMVA